MTKVVGNEEAPAPEEPAEEAKEEAKEEAEEEKRERKISIKDKAWPKIGVKKEH